MTDLERIALAVAIEAGELHPCSGGHTLRFVGGKNASCHRLCTCSVPVYECRICGGCDYGDNDEAREIIDDCLMMGGSLCPGAEWIELAPCG